MSFFSALSSQWDVLSGRFAAVRLPASGAERDAATAVLEMVRGEELHRVVDNDPWASPAFGGTAVPVADFAVVDQKQKRTVGVLQYAAVRDLMALPGTVEAYALDRLSDSMQARSVAVTFFALLPEARKSAAGFVLLVEACRWAISSGACAAVFIAEPPLLGRYTSLGAWPLSPMRASAYGGYRIPLALLLADRDTLERVHSPLRFAVKPNDFAADDESLRFKADFERRYGRISTGVRAYDENEDGDVHQLLTRGMGDVDVDACLKSSLTLQSAPGDKILARGDGGAVLGVVASGVVHVVVGGRVVAALGKGEPFGEMAFATGQPRTADLVAASPDTSVLQLSPTALKQLRPEASAILWKNLAWCLARRLEATTAQLG